MARTPAQRRLHRELLLAEPLLNDRDRDLIRQIWYRIEQFVIIDDYVHFRLHEPRCHVCRSPWRSHIEVMARLNFLVYGPGSTRGIVALLPADAGVSWRSIRRHLSRGHDPMLRILRQFASWPPERLYDNFPPGNLGANAPNGTPSGTFIGLDTLRQHLLATKAELGQLTHTTTGRSVTTDAASV